MVPIILNNECLLPFPLIAATAELMNAILELLVNLRRQPCETVTIRVCKACAWIRTLFFLRSLWHHIVVLIQIRTLDERALILVCF